MLVVKEKGTPCQAMLQTDPVKRTILSINATARDRDCCHVFWVKFSRDRKQLTALTGTGSQSHCYIQACSLTPRATYLTTDCLLPQAVQKSGNHAGQWRKQKTDERMGQTWHHIGPPPRQYVLAGTSSGCMTRCICCQDSGQTGCLYAPETCSGCMGCWDG
ncbi:hypothetical protein SRHO_G00112630 [Serrasalmus rhombeus]